MSNPKTLVLYFHRISDEVSPAFPPMPIKVFEQLLKFLKQRYLIIPLEEIGQSFQSKKSCFIITFDDAFFDFYENAFPLLKKHQVPAVLNVVTNCAETGKTIWTQHLNKLVETYFKLGRQLELIQMSGAADQIKKPSNIESVAIKLYYNLLKNQERERIITNWEKQINHPIEKTPMMNWSQVKECSQNRVLIGSHTHNHLNVSLLSEAELGFEFGHSSLLLEKNLGFKPKVLAYPNGAYSEKAIKIAAESGYKYLLTTEERSIRQLNLKNEEINVIPRFNVFHNAFWKTRIKLGLAQLFK